MKQHHSRFLMNRTAKAYYIFSGVFSLFFISLLFLNPQSWVLYFLLLSIIFHTLRDTKGYRLSDKDTIDSFRLFWQAKNKSIDIQSILAIQEESPKKLLIQYQKEGISSPSVAIFLLKAEDVLYLKEELLRRNPEIKVLR